MLSRLFGRNRNEPGTVAKLPGDLWLDRPDARKQIERRRKRGTINDHQVDKLRQFVDEGWFSFPIDLPEEITRDLEESVNRFWNEKPSDVLFAYDALLTRFTHSDESKQRRSPYRIMEMHRASRGARFLYLNRQIFDWVELIFDEPAVATQSIYFEFGSQQGLHRDPVYVYMTPASHLVAVWIALEDIQQGSGELVYVPGSHRLPYLDFGGGRWTFDFGSDGPEKTVEMQQFDEKNARARGLSAQRFLPRKGEVLIWHSSLLHGGSAVSDPSLTRKSFVVHYTTLRNYESHSQMVTEHEGDRSENRIYTTKKVLEENGCHGFDSPLETDQ